MTTQRHASRWPSFLSDEGYRVRQAANGTEALMAIAERSPALLLLDLVMAGLSGADVLEQLDSAGQHGSGRPYDRDAAHC